MGWPVVIAENGIGIAVTESDNALATPVEIAENGYGTPVVVVEAGGLPVTGLDVSPPSGITNGLIYDPDMDSDNDDINDAAYVLHYIDAGVKTLSAVTACSRATSVAPFLRVVLDAAGHPDVPMGTYKGSVTGVDDSSSFCANTVAVYRGGDTGANYEDAVRVMRRAMLTWADGTGVIFPTGTLTNVHDLLLSPGDDISPLTGMELVALKVKEIVIAGGLWPSGSGFEANIPDDIAAANYVAANSPVDLVWCGNNIADGGTGVHIWTSANPAIDPLKYAWNDAGSANRDANSFPAMDYLFNGLGTDWSYGPRGDASFNPSTGYPATFTPNASGISRYIELNASLATKEAEWQGILDAYGAALHAKLIGGSLARKVFEYKFDASSGQTIADASGNGRDIIKGASTSASTDDPTSGADGLSFDGGDFLRRAANLDFSAPGDMVLVAVVNPTSFAAQRQIISRDLSAGPRSFQMRTAITTGNFEFAGFSGNTATSIASTVALSAAAWALVMVRVRGIAVELYIGDTLRGSGNLAVPVVRSNQITEIGTRNNSVSSAFLGKMAYFAMHAGTSDAMLQGIRDEARAYAATLGITV